MTSKVVTRHNYPNANDKDFEIQLGETLLKAGLLSATQLAEAMFEKTENALRLEEICIEQGWVAPEVLYSFVPSHSLPLVAILFLYGILSIEQLREILTEQRRQPQRRVGEMLVEKGWIQEGALKWLLREQKEIHRLGAPNSWELISRRRLDIDIRDILQDPTHSDARTPQEKINAYKHHLHVLENQLEIKQQEINDVTERLTQRIHELEGELNQHSSQGTRSVEVEQDLRQNLTNFQQQLSTTQVTLQSQQWLNQQLSEEVVRYKDQVRDLTNELQNQEQRYQDLVAERGKDQEHLQAWTVYRHDAEAQIKLYADELNQALNQLQDAEAEARAHQEQLKEAESRTEKIQATNARLLAELAAARRQKVELEAQLQTQQQAASEQTEHIQQQLEEEQEKQAALVLQAQEQQAAHLKRIQTLEEALQKQIANNRKLLARLKSDPKSDSQPSDSQSAEDDPFGLVDPSPARRTNDTRLPSTNTGGLRPPEDVRSPQKSLTGLAEDEQKLLEPLPTWAQNLLLQLRLADLMGSTELKKTLANWERGGTLTDALVQCTRLQMSTIHFFADESASQIKGAKSIADYLRAAGLASQEQLLQATRAMTSGQSLTEILVEHHVLRPATANYFMRRFISKVG